MMAGAAGFEPAITGSKPDALPLGYAPNSLTTKRPCQSGAQIKHFVRKAQRLQSMSERMISQTPVRGQFIVYVEWGKEGMSFRDFTDKERRRDIVILLSQGSTASRWAVGEALADLGYKASDDLVGSDLAWLDEQGLIEQGAGGRWSLTTRGRDVARGRAWHPGLRH